MKRLLISIVLLGMVGGICVFSLYTQQKGTRELLELLDQMEDAYKTNDMDRCQQLSDQFPDTLDQKTRFFSLFQYHSYLSSIKEVAVTLPVILRGEDQTHYPIELVHCRSLLERLEELETPTLENIL